jgi:hypothetical protein
MKKKGWNGNNRDSISPGDFMRFYKNTSHKEKPRTWHESAAILAGYDAVPFEGGFCPSHPARRINLHEFTPKSKSR